VRLKVHNPPYTVEIGRGLLPTLPPEPRDAVLLYDLAVEAIAEAIAHQASITARIGVPGGERAKTLETYARLLSDLAKSGLGRDGVLYVVGGGTLTDLGGFLAATYLRGIVYQSFPTTTLAIVDASVGGKTGLNLPEGKNLVGAFHAPERVTADLDWLVTLPERTFKEGLVEAYKHGFIAGDPDLLDPFDLHPEHPRLEAYLSKAVAVKIAVVSADFREKGERRKLNLGHTLAHALEAVTDHALTHGEAVAYGLLFACLLGRRLGGEDLVDRALDLLDWLDAPPLPPLSWSTLLPYLERDKKKAEGEIHWVIPLELGKLTITPLEGKLLEETYQSLEEVLR